MRKKAADALPGSGWTPFEINPNLPPERADIVIVGGGVMGWSVAYWLKQKERVRGGVKVVVVEKDPTVRGGPVTGISTLIHSFHNGISLEEDNRTQIHLHQGENRNNGSKSTLYTVPNTTRGFL